MHISISKFNVEFNDNMCYLVLSVILWEIYLQILVAEIKNGIRAIYREETFNICINLSNQAIEVDRMSLFEVKRTSISDFFIFW